MAKWQAGATVRLKSGGPIMTVDGYTSAMPNETPSTVICKWFEGSKSEKASFHEDSLKAADPDEDDLPI